MANTRPSSQQKSPLDLHITIISAKHLKNVNWRHGDLKPYAIFWLDPDRRLATKPDDTGSTKPVWNETFTLPINPNCNDLVLTLEIFHSKPSETPKPLVGSLDFNIKELVDSAERDGLSFAKIAQSLEVRRPSGRPQGVVRLKMVVRERPMPVPIPAPIPTPVSEYQYKRTQYNYAPSVAPMPPQYGDYRVSGYSSPMPYTSSAPAPQGPPGPPPSLGQGPGPAYGQPLQSGYGYGGGYTDSYSNYYPGYYAQPPPQPPRPFFDRQSSLSYGGGGSGVGQSGPSAPVDYTGYEQKQQKGSKMGMGLGAGLAVGAVAGALGGLALEEGLKYEEEKIAERVENDVASRGDYDSYRDY